MPSTLIQKGKGDSTFARILTAIKEAETALQERKASSCQVNLSQEKDCRVFQHSRECL